MKTRENIAKILSDIITDNPNYDTLELAEAMYNIGYCDRVVDEQEAKMNEGVLHPYYGN